MGLWTGAGYVNPNDYGKPFGRPKETKVKVYCKDCKHFSSTGEMRWNRFHSMYKESGFQSCNHPSNLEKIVVRKSTYYEVAEYEEYKEYLHPSTRNKDNDCKLFTPIKDNAWEV